MDYKASGVDVDAGNETVRRIRGLARSTFTSGVLSDIGSFGGLFRLDSGQYRETVVRVYRQLRAQGRDITLLAHVLDSPVADNDVPALHAFAEVTGHTGEVLVPTTLDEARSALAGAQLVVGSRMHACLNALSVGTPAIPLAYSRKFAPLLNDLGWSHSVDLRTSPDPAGQLLSLADADDLQRRARATQDRARELLETASAAIRRVS